MSYAVAEVNEKTAGGKKYKTMKRTMISIGVSVVTDPGDSGEKRGG